MLFIFVSHDMSLMMDTCDRLIIMNKGRLVEEVSCSDYNMIKNEYTKELMASTFVI